MGIEKYFNVIKEGVQSSFGSSVSEAKKISEAKGGGEMLGEMMATGLRAPLNIFGQSVKTSLKISALLGWDTLKLIGKGIGRLPLLPLPAANNPEQQKTQSITNVINSTRKNYNSLVTV